MAEDVPPGHLDESTALSEAGKACVDEAFAGEAVEHDVNALAASGRENFFAELGLAAVEYVLDAERTEKRLFRGAGRGEHLRACGLCQLNGRQSNSARSGVNENALSRLQPREFVRKRG